MHTHIPTYIHAFMHGLSSFPAPAEVMAGLFLVLGLVWVWLGGSREWCGSQSSPLLIYIFFKIIGVTIIR